MTIRKMRKQKIVEAPKQESHRNMLDKILGDLNHQNRTFFDTLSTREKQLLGQILEEVGLRGHSHIMDTLWDIDYLEKPLPVREWLKDPYYMGEIGDSMYPKWTEEHAKIFKVGYRPMEWIFCLSGDTKIPLLRGKVRTLKQLHTRFEKVGKPFWVYSVDERGNTVPGKCTKVTKFSKDQLYKMTLDDGSVIKANADHEFVCRDGKKRRLRDLKAGDALMPFETKLSEKGDGGRLVGYERVLHPATGEFEYTHKMSARYRCGALPNSFGDDRSVIHHFESLVEAAPQCSKLSSLGELVGCSRGRIYKILEEAGLTWEAFAKQYCPHAYKYRNHKIASIEKDAVDHVYCLTVPEWGNFAIETKDGSGVYSGNTGAIGGGKTWNAVVAQLRVIYELSLLRDPQAFYKLAPGSAIIFGLYNVHKYKVETTSFGYMAEMIARSPYFKEKFARDKSRTTAIIFPNNVRVISGSTELHALGENIFSVLIDEAAFMKEAKDKEKLGQAHKLHAATVRRMESRFMKLGRIPGLICLVSSKQHESDYVEAFIRKNEGKAHVHVSDFSHWAVKPEEDYCGDMFRVMVGSATLQSKILTATEIPPIDARVLEVPVEYRRAFEDDVDEAIRDIAGVATYGTYTFITQREKVFECINDDRDHPFKKESIVLDIYSPIEIADFVNMKKLFRIRNSKYQVKHRPDALRFIHVDLALTGDSASISMGHQDGFVEKAYQSEDGSSYSMQLPIIRYDFMLRINPPIGSEIDLSKIREFIVMLREYGFQISKVSYDGFQSADSIQSLKKNNFDAMLLSVDRTDAAYVYMKQALVEKRVDMYEYEPFLSEILSVQRDLKTMKIDHPEQMTTIHGETVKGSKDVSDSAVAVCQHIMEAEDLNFRGEIQPAQRATSTEAVPDYGSNNQDLEWLIRDNPVHKKLRGFSAR